MGRRVVLTCKREWEHIVHSHSCFHMKPTGMQGGLLGPLSAVTLCSDAKITPPCFGNPYGNLLDGWTKNGFDEPLGSVIRPHARLLWWGQGRGDIVVGGDIVVVGQKGCCSVVVAGGLRQML